MTTTTVSGATSSGQSISSGDQVVVESGGVTVSYTVLSGGEEVVNSSGTASATTVSNGGREYIYSGGTASGTIVSSGGVETVVDGGTTTGTTVSSGGAEYVYSGTANGTTVLSGGAEYVYGGTASGTTVSSGGVEFVYSGGTANGVNDEAGGFVVALPGANVTGVTGSGTVVSTGVFYDSAGTPVSATAVSGLSLKDVSDQVDILQGGTTTATSLAGGAVENVYSGGTASGTTVSDGSVEYVYSSGMASGTIVSNGGAAYVLSGGTTTGTIVSSGGAAYVYSGTTTGTTVSSGGLEVVENGGATSGTMLASGGGELVYGTAIGTIVSSGGAEFVSNGGTASGITVSNGGFEFVYSGGTVSGVNDAASGIVVALPGATITGVTGAGKVISTGVLYDSAGTPVSKTAVSGLSLNGSGFYDQVYVLQGGTTTATSLAGGANETVFSGGAASGTVVSGGGVEVISSAGTASGTVVSDGGVEVVSSGGTVSGSIVSNGGGEYVDYGGTASGITVSSGGVEYVDGGTATSTTFAPGGELDLRAITFGSGETASINPSALLTVTSGGNTVYSQQLAPSDANYVANVTGAPDGDTLVTIAVCFASGTAIRTTRGDVAVEALAVGDIAVTASGARRPIRWLGHRTIDCRNHPRPNDAWPVRIAAQAFGEGRPERDLYLSPGHPVLVGADDDGNGGHLVPIMCLVNGTTIKRVPVDAVTYWHVELDGHDILLAEGLPAESYLDWGDRAFFTEGSDHTLHNPDFVVPGLAARCRPVALEGPIVDVERRRLDTVFASRLAAACAWPAEHDAMTGLCDARPAPARARLEISAPAAISAPEASDVDWGTASRFRMLCARASLWLGASRQKPTLR